MARKEKTTLVYATGNHESYWKQLPLDVITVPNFNLLCAAIQGAVRDFDRDIRYVVLDARDERSVYLDRSVSSDQFLRLVAGLPQRFLGDVVSIFPDGSGYLSAIGHSEGRILYRMEEADVDFYLEVHFGTAVHPLAWIGPSCDTYAMAASF